MELRIKEAKTLLRGANSPIAEVAAQLGFTDQSHFTNAFRNATGMTPGAYRNS